MKNLKYTVEILQWDKDIARALVTFPEMPGYAIQVQTAAVAVAGVRMISVYGCTELGNYSIDNVLPCTPDNNVHCGEGLSDFFRQEHFVTALIGPILRLVKDITDISLQLRPVSQASYLEQNLQRVLGNVFTQG